MTGEDPTSFQGVTYTGRGERRFFDRRVDAWITVNAHLFAVRYEGREIIEFQVNPEFGSKEAARAEVDTYASALGRLPLFLLSRVDKVTINDGYELWGGNGQDRSILIHTDKGREYIQEGFLEEVMIHEAAHVSLDGVHEYSQGWREAQVKDCGFISEYAREHPYREDVAESFLPYYALRYYPERLADSDRAAILNAIPHRIAFFDECVTSDTSVAASCHVQTARIHKLQGVVVGPDDNPLEGIGIWAWQGERANSGFGRTDSRGAFAIDTPEGAFTLDIYAGPGCSFVGWYDGDGITDIRDSAVRVLEGTQGLKVRLPDLPKNLPRIEWCAS
ncbi:MAG: hypothetical protein OXL97_14335 [Chloroflexota bacterium]|nr:hypothetical protein [Chloroflexota bacterium]MDE2885935.1 hypothetical protein [Chloroflexota bacterium]